MYTEREILESLSKVEASREQRLKDRENIKRMTAEEKEAILKAYHPDYKDDNFENLKIGVNKGDKVPHELADMLQANPRINTADIDLANPTYDVDVLVIGGGGSGASAAIEAHEAGANV
ncbi:MAG: succinate dehydrogenase/fumarate reductase flavoprotein subunit, partial [Clostridia bacterium]|nr:succinate dehydrogenase/fumarate reductase flavoprotein subunit [Clostridia bacterium]